MLMTESQLRRYVRRQLSEQYQSYPLKGGVPDDPRIPPEDVPVIRAASKNAVTRDATVEVTDDEIHISIFSPHGESIAFLTHDLKNDKWSGAGPSDRETEMFGERDLNKEDVMQFANDMGMHKGFMKSLFRM